MKSQPDKTVMVTFSVGFYIVTAICMVMVNKAVLNKTETPITFLTLQIFVAVILLRISHKVNFIQLPVVDYKTFKRLIPLIVINVLGLTMNTLCLQHADASFYQVARGLVLPFTVILSWLCLRKGSSFSIILACSLVCGGFFVGTRFDSTISQSGQSTYTNQSIFYGVVSSVTTAIHAIVIKTSLEVVNGNTIQLVYYNNLFSAIGCIPVMLFMGELGPFCRLLAGAMVEMVYGGNAALVSTNQSDAVTQLSTRFQDVAETDNLAYGSLAKLQVFILGTIITGGIGFLLNLAGFLQIKVTSPVTHMISSAVRGVIQTVLAIILFGDVVTTARIVGIILILFGSSLYSLIRGWEAQDKERASLKERERKENWAGHVV